MYLHYKVSISHCLRHACMHAYYAMCSYLFTDVPVPTAVLITAVLLPGVVILNDVGILL